MEIEIVSEKQNPLLSRKEISFRIKHPKSATPKRSEIRDKIVAKFDANKEASYVVKINKLTGRREVMGIIHVYDDPAVAKKVEPQYIISRNEGKKTREPKEPKPPKPEVIKPAPSKEPETPKPETTKPTTPQEPETKKLEGE
ncbi:MAG: 30S ribosomal protein S24e [Candidatus Ranarchaeia archaeon]|jgi:small subunit ribosomal protein S24e